LSNLTDQLAAAQEAYDAAKARFEGITAADDPQGKRDAETAVLATRKTLREAEAAAEAERAGEAAAALAARRDAFDDEQGRIAQRQAIAFLQLQEYGRELHRLEREDKALRAAYADLTPGEQLPSAEARWRHRPAQPEQVLSETDAEQWIAGHSDLPVGPLMQSRIVPEIGGFGGWLQTTTGRVQCIREAAKEETYLPSRQAYQPEPLVADLRIPEDPPVTEREPRTRLKRLQHVRPPVANPGTSEEQGEAA
jgi:hypothetical protein